MDSATQSESKSIRLRSRSESRDVRSVKSGFVHGSADGKDAENIKFGSTLSKPQHRGIKFDYCLANPPYGKEWKNDQEAVEAEAERGYAGRFGAGLPRISDGQLRFRKLDDGQNFLRLQHSRMFAVRYSPMHNIASLQIYRGMGMQGNLREDLQPYVSEIMSLVPWIIRHTTTTMPRGQQQRRRRRR